jgi:hypothetical protein
MGDKLHNFIGNVLRKHPGAPDLVVHFSDSGSIRKGDTCAVIPKSLQDRPGVEIGSQVSGTFEVVDGQSRVVEINSPAL